MASLLGSVTVQRRLEQLSQQRSAVRVGQIGTFDFGPSCRQAARAIAWGGSSKQ
jgi:hypothetical protein